MYDYQDFVEKDEVRFFQCTFFTVTFALSRRARVSTTRRCILLVFRATNSQTSVHGMHTRRDRVTRIGTCRWHERGVFQTLLGIKDTVGIQIQAAAPSSPDSSLRMYVFIPVIALYSRRASPLPRQTPEKVRSSIYIIGGNFSEKLFNEMLVVVRVNFPAFYAEKNIFDNKEATQIRVFTVRNEVINERRFFFFS